ncbi:hypothetical protein [Azospirillum sp. B4]|uniref:hypothetical protein n=1 Tax=Azospirillum sp. B4 TaxID=95605 RepID=UPI0005C898DF|nr:hypothetical protein [Azospirillum sp. B4]
MDAIESHHGTLGVLLLLESLIQGLEKKGALTSAEVIGIKTAAKQRAAALAPDHPNRQGVIDFLNTAFR